MSLSVKKMAVTDLDGTLFGTDHSISKKNLDVLHNLGEAGITRVIATGRSTFSAKKSLPGHLPIDYLVYSSGSGIEDWASGKLLKSVNLTKEEVNGTFHILAGKGMDIFILDAVPDNHRCAYLRQKRNNPDFERRIELYKDFAREINFETFEPAESCQLIVIENGKDAVNIFNETREKIANLNIIRSTSPIDGESLWIEIFPKEASKANGLKYLSELLGILPENTMVVGNDYNDLDMLRWTKHPFVVANSPEELKHEFTGVSSNDEDGFAEAVERWLLE
jgi:Cof subfamily protein (haloacid dehalogenase superfamily)